MAVNGIPEMVDEHNGILVAPKDPTSLAQAIAQMMNAYPMLDHDEIADRAQARYSMESVGRSITDVYEAVLSNSALIPAGVKKDR
jgi:glycosyltransferase involved in cell wall biosynthesis